MIAIKGIYAEYRIKRPFATPITAMASPCLRFPVKCLLLASQKGHRIACGDVQHAGFVVDNRLTHPNSPNIAAHISGTSPLLPQWAPPP
jgi:hypothetical protein